ncbi:MAG TPA: hypothetical protein VGN77_07640 [Steroidobacteraceae bacterium]|nr:hypothetical protein [Steroidobacteraceae bacterium]
MNANRALGLLAAILVTAGQAMVFAVDTAAAAQSSEELRRFDAALGATNFAEGQLAYSASRGLIGG